MNKDCIGYKIDNETLCRSCGNDRLNEPDPYSEIIELHAESRRLRCSRCGGSLGESEDQ